jgi:hypothetical protein
VTWLGAIHEGKGHIQPIVNERATAPQRERLLRIMSGQDTEPGATFFQVFPATGLSARSDTESVERRIES